MSWATSRTAIDTATTSAAAKRGPLPPKRNAKSSGTERAPKRGSTGATRSCSRRMPAPSPSANARPSCPHAKIAPASPRKNGAESVSVASASPRNTAGAGGPLPCCARPSTRPTTAIAAAAARPSAKVAGSINAGASPKPLSIASTARTAANTNASVTSSAVRRKPTDLCCPAIGRPYSPLTESSLSWRRADIHAMTRKAASAPCVVMKNPSGKAETSTTLSDCAVRGIASANSAHMSSAANGKRRRRGASAPAESESAGTASPIILRQSSLTNFAAAGDSASLAGSVQARRNCDSSCAQLHAGTYTCMNDQMRGDETARREDTLGIPPPRDLLPRPGPLFDLCVRLTGPQFVGPGTMCERARSVKPSHTRNF